jgi:hypothetical protein
MGKRKSDAKARTALTTPDQIDHSILVIRGHKVLLDAQLAAFYGIETKIVMQAVKRNLSRFPVDFMFQLNSEEWDALRSQIATSNLRSQIVTSSSRGHGGRRYPPYTFTEQGVAMLSSVLRSPRAIEVNIQIMRAFVRLRQLLSEHKELADRLTKLEQQMRDRDENVDRQFREVFALLERLFSPATPSRRPIGFHAGGC